MKLENQVCSLEQAKRLHELGIEKHKSLFSYWPNPRVLEGGAVEPDGTYEILPTNTKRTYASAVKDSAFTVAELGVMIDDYFESHSSMDKKTWYCGRLEGGEDEYFGMCNTEAQARAEMLLYLIGNGLITVEEANKRLSNS